MNRTIRHISYFLFSICLTTAYAADDAAEGKESPASTPAPAVTPAKPTPAPKNEISEILDSMGYPELQVVPRASERLSIEAKNEDSMAAITHWPIQFSGLITLAVGFSAKSNQRDNLTDKEKSDSSMISTVTTAVGLGWLVIPGVYALQRPYRSGINSINKYPGKDDRSTLLRERLAEEAMEKPARTMQVLKTIAVISNFTVNAATAWHSNETGKVMAGVGILLSFTPWIFEDHSIDVYEKQLEYKKKIYTPIKSAYMGYDSLNKNFYPMTAFTWMF